MRSQHPVFDIPTEQDLPVWRYFDFPKFVFLLEQRGLYFSRADLLGDPLEGSFTRARQAEREHLLAHPPEGRTTEDLQEVFQQHAGMYADVVSHAYINCWHLGDHESMAMWQGYGGGAYGVAIRSSWRLLDECLPATCGDYPMSDIYIGRVNYIDYSSESQRIPHEGNAYAPFLCKSVAYRHESELRAVFIDIGGYQGVPPAGRSMPIDLQKLVERVTVSPLAPAWFEQLVQNVCARFGLQFTVNRSIVLGAPIF